MPTSKKDRIIESWTQLTQLVEQYGDGWVFRGEDSPRYDKLAPKAGRVSKKRDSVRKIAHRTADEVRALDEFKQLARPYLRHAPRSDMEWLALAQHHGLPTRLLDWTGSLYVAAFFAVEAAGTLGAPRMGSAVIYAVRDVPAINPEENPFEILDVKMYQPSDAVTVRVPAQRSLFTIHPRPTESFTFPTLQRWVIAYDLAMCMQIKKLLAEHGINEGTLFRDVDSVARYVAWHYKWGFRV